MFWIEWRKPHEFFHSVFPNRKDFVSPDVFLRKHFIRSTNSSLFICVANSPLLTDQKIKENRSLSLVEMHQQSTRFQEVRMNNRKEASFSPGSYGGYSLYIYVYIHFQYFPAEKLIVHVNGYSFRLGISYGNTSFMYYIHSFWKSQYWYSRKRP